MKNKIKNNLIKYRSVVVIGMSLTFNLVSSLLVWHPDGVKWNKTPMTVLAWFCDIISIVCFFTGVAMIFFDLHLDEKRRIKEAILECNEELKADEDSVASIHSSEEER